jgi:hypothetical protein
VRTYDRQVCLKRHNLAEQSERIPSQEEVKAPKILPEVSDVLLKYAYPLEVMDLLKKKEVPQGSRSEALMLLGYSLAEMGLPSDEIYALIQHKDKSWGKYVNRADKKTRYASIVQTAKTKYPKAVSGGTEEAPEEQQPGRDLLVLGWNSLAAYTVDFDWVVEGMFMQNTMNILGGKAGTGKTQLSIRFAENLALGREHFLGFPIPKPRKVLFLSLELNLVGVKIFQELMNKTLTDDERETLEKNLLIVPVGNPIDLTSPFGQESINYLIEQWEPDVLMVDSMGSSVPGGLAKTEKVSELLWFNDRLNTKGVSTWYITHPRKSEAAQSQNRRPSLDDLFGDVYQVNRARGVYGLHDTKKEGKLELITLKQSFAKNEHKGLFIERSDDLNFSVTEPPKSSSNGKKSSSLLDHYSSNEETPGNAAMEGI